MLLNSLKLLAVFALLVSCSTGKEKLHPEVKLLGPMVDSKVKKTDSVKSLSKKSKMSRENFRMLNGLKKGQSIQSKPVAKIRLKKIPSGLSWRNLHKIAKKNRSKIQKCYDKLIKINPKKQGVMILDIEIDSSGAVNSVTYSYSSVRNLALEGCVAGEVSGWEFPKLADGASISIKYPILFKANYIPPKKTKKKK